MPPVRGVRLAVYAARIRYQDRTDLLMVEFAPGTTVAGCFTRSTTAAAPVDWCRSALEGGRARALLVNAGNANAFTGNAGERAVERSVLATSDVLHCPVSEVFVASTGIIGQPLPVEKIILAVPRLHDRLADGGWLAAAQTISTTDTFPKGACRRAEIGGVPVAVIGIAKGAGMIAPDMATMLAFVFTAAAISQPVLQHLTERAVARSFNCITIDGDTSTNDTLLVFATGVAPHSPITDTDDPRLESFARALDGVMIDLAQQIVRDGEGASKFVTVEVTGATDDAGARTIALSIANSPLVKTAIAGEDANWGRIIMAVGKAGVSIERERLAVHIGGIAVAAAGGAVPHLDEAPVTAHMHGREISIAVEVGGGAGRATVWTCDLTHGYIDINADYRT